MIKNKTNDASSCNIPIQSKFVLFQNVANVLLIGVKGLNAYSHWAINDEFERTAPTLVFLLMLACRMVVDWQMVKRDKEEAEEAAKARSKATKDAAKAELEEMSREAESAVSSKKDQ